jgi:hypothetical protein
MTHMTKKDAISSAISVAEDIREGRLDPVDLQQQAVAECKALLGTVVGPDDPLWAVQLEVCRGVLAAHGIPANELAEWLAVARRAADTLN